MLMTDRAPGLSRSFAAQNAKYLAASVWKDAFEEARSEIKTDAVFEAYASDIDPECVRIAGECAERAGVDRYNPKLCSRRARNRNGRQARNDGPQSALWERLLDRKQCEALYKTMGQNWKKAW